MPRRLSYPHVASTLALVLAIGGVAEAAFKVGTRNIRNGAVTAPKIARNAVDGTKVRNRSLTGADIDLGRLGVVPRAALANRATIATHYASEATIIGTRHVASGIQFEPSDSTFQWIRSNMIWATAGCSATTGFGYQLRVPNGVTVTGLTFHVVDDSAASALLIMAALKPDASPVETLALQSTATLPQSSNVQAVDVPLPTPTKIDNGTRAYEVVWAPGSTDCSANQKLAGIEVRYTN
jgi:hypothetical protein